jgi:hypothetical protein
VLAWIQIIEEDLPVNIIDSRPIMASESDKIKVLYASFPTLEQELSLFILSIAATGFTNPWGTSSMTH